MQKLNFPSYSFRVKNNENNPKIFDVIRKKFFVLTPEEWVRQHCLTFLILDKGYPKSLINVEKELIINGLKKRYDIVVFNPDGSINILIECKATSVKISQTTFDQIAQYNMALNAQYLMVTNGLNHYYCTVNFHLKSYNFLAELPNYNV